MPPLGQFSYRGHSPKPDDPDILASITDSQHHGYSHRVTASRAQIAKDTLTNWLNLGRAELRAWDQSEADYSELGSLGRFAAHFESAAAECEAGNTAAIMASIHNKEVAFVPALIMNKARNPADWLEARQVDMTVNAQLSVTYVHELDPGAAKAIAQNILTALTDLDTGDPETTPTPLLPEATTSQPADS